VNGRGSIEVVAIRFTFSIVVFVLHGSCVAYQKPHFCFPMEREGMNERKRAAM
jgi:hypothetical protein